MFIICFLIFLMGISIGSFLNVCIYRLPLSISVAKGRSFCPNCYHPLHALDLFPIFSYLFLGRKCRYCHHPISPRYASVELLTGIMYLFTFWVLGLTPYAIIGCLFFSILLVITFIDFSTLEIPDGLVISILILSVISSFLPSTLSVMQRCFGLILGGGILLLITYISKGGMGGGDIKLVAAVGFLLGPIQVILGFFLAAIFASVYALYLLISKKKNIKEAIPFGPFLSLAYFILYLYGTSVVRWYVGLLGW